MQTRCNYTYICGMEKHLTYLDAWADFWQWIRQPEQRNKWKAITRQQQQYIYKANIAHRNGALGYERTKNILCQYAPDRYEFKETVILHQ